MVGYTLPTPGMPDPSIGKSILTADILALILSLNSHTICDNRRISIDTNFKLIGY
jgi:hypothetical protein